MNEAFFEALELMAKERSVDIESLAEKVKFAISVALRKEYPNNDTLKIILDTQKKEFGAYITKTVVKEVQDKNNEISYKEAKKIQKDIAPGDCIEISLNTQKIGRIAAQSAKHVIRQGVRDVEREALAEIMGNKVGKAVTVEVKSIDSVTGNVLVELEKNEFILFRDDLLPTDHLQPGQLIKVYVAGFLNSDRRSALKLSRTHKDMISALFALEVPEIADGTVSVQAVARDAGSRSKIAVYSNDENVDPIGACIGEKNIRIQSVIHELGGEKIDLIKYSENAEEFISRSLSPAKVVSVEIQENTNEHIAFVNVVDSQLSLAIGNRGQNAKLAARLTGYKIDIRPESGFYTGGQGQKFENRLKKK